MLPNNSIPQAPETTATRRDNGNRSVALPQGGTAAHILLTYSLAQVRCRICRRPVSLLVSSLPTNTYDYGHSTNHRRKQNQAVTTCEISAKTAVHHPTITGDGERKDKTNCSCPNQIGLDERLHRSAKLRLRLSPRPTCWIWNRDGIASLPADDRSGKIMTRPCDGQAASGPG